MATVEVKMVIKDAEPTLFQAVSAAIGLDRIVEQQQPHLQHNHV